MDFCLHYRDINCHSSFVRGDFNIIEKEFISAVTEDTWAAHPISDLVSPLDQPLGGFGVARRPCLAARACLAVRQVFDLQLQPVPGVSLPREGLTECAHRLDLPGTQLDLLNITEQHQLVTLSD